MSATFGLEYALFFGVPDNKIELLEGESRWIFPFLSRDEAEAHFDEWIETIRRWKQIESSVSIDEAGRNQRTDIGGIRIELFPRPIELRFPMEWDAFDALLHTFNRRDYWPDQPQGFETGWDSSLDDGDIRMNLWSMFREYCDRHGGQHSGRVDISLSPWAGVAPDAFYYGAAREEIMIEDDYFGAAPDLVVEVLSAPSRWLDRGPRKEVYRRARVPNLWLVEPILETVEVYELHGHYELVDRYHRGDSFASPLFPGEEISTNAIFTTQSKRRKKEKLDDKVIEPVPEWILPPEAKIGLEYFFHLGHPERRWEFWDNKAHSVLAFGSGTEASARLDHLLTEACCWESLPRPKIAQLAAEVDQTEVGRFQFTRRDRLVFLELAIDGRRHHEILRRWADRHAWDWGEE